MIGVLAFQGDFQEHLDVLAELNMAAMEVRNLDDLKKVKALIIPGGESTVIAKFLESTGVGKEIQRRIQNPARDASRGEPLSVYGTCAGAIILGSKATGKNAPTPLGLIDVTVDRNAYGSQVDSFETDLTVKGIKGKVAVAFIRAPKITKVGKGVEVLATYDGDPVLVRQGNVLAGTFHPEARGETKVHEFFLEISTL